MDLLARDFHFKCNALCPGRSAQTSVMTLPAEEIRNLASIFFLW